MLVIVLKNIFVSLVDLDGRREEVSHSSLWTVKTDSLKRNDKKHILFNIVQPNGRSILRPTLQTAIVQRRYETVFQRIHLETMFESCVCVCSTQSLTFLLSHSLQVSLLLALLNLQMLHECSSKCPVAGKMEISSIWLKISYVLHMPFTSNQWISSSNVNFSIESLSNLMNSIRNFHDTISTYEMEIFI